MAVKGARVDVHYCNGVHFLRYDDEDMVEAVQEYVHLLTEAVEPTMEHPKAYHIRLVTFMAYGEAGRVLFSMQSGIFGCSHLDI